MDFYSNGSFTATATISHDGSCGSGARIHTTAVAAP
jgi:hypothetical protein